MLPVYYLPLATAQPYRLTCIWRSLQAHLSIFVGMFRFYIDCAYLAETCYLLFNLILSQVRIPLRH